MRERERSAGLDNDWFMTRLSYPYNEIPQHALESMRQEMSSRFPRKQSAHATVADTASWVLAGPSNIGGRVTSLLIHPADRNIIYAGSASGGVWKTTDFGTTWTNVFNESFSIGSLAFEPGNPNVVYVGTGEANPAGVATYPGNGIWRSTDAGTTWTNLGLTQTGHIGKIVINPHNPNQIFVAALGLYRGKTADRGIYRSNDHGSTWSQVLFLNDTTGGTDVVFSPVDTSTIFAAMWVRYRTPHVSILSGPSSGLYVSLNSGGTWSLVGSGFPSNSATLGRISLATAPSDSSIMYALVASDANWGGVYKSTNAGFAWTKTYDGGTSGETQVWYNNVITVDPYNSKHVWSGMTSFYQSTDGSSYNIDFSYGGHVDHHAIAYAPSDSNTIVIGNDGGIFISTDGGNSWSKSYDLPITQFYAGFIAQQNPQYLLGGTQDNSSMRTHTNVVDSWTFIYCCDGFYCLVDPTDTNYVYAEAQNGGLGYSTDGGGSFFDGTIGISGSDRKNWETPIAMDLQHPKTLYTGTQRVYRTTNNMQSWTAISGDLTYGDGGRVGTISTIDVSATDSNVVYAGTDDGRVQVTTNGGGSWQSIGDSLPQRWVTRITVDPDSSNIAYVTLSGFIQYDFGGHIYRTTNYGTTWTNIGATLPDVPINDVVVDPMARTHLYIGTDLNVMYTTDLGTSWNIFGTNLPDVPVHDLALHSTARKLVAFTHGRSAFSTNLAPLTSVNNAPVEVPQQFVLEQNYPNPFNPVTRIQYSVMSNQYITIKIYDVLGREVQTLVNEKRQPGSYDVTFDATKFPSGIYIYTLRAGNISLSRKMVLTK
jgi:photosystem II stability/assembly factor-like uncharacterized protein